MSKIVILGSCAASVKIIELVRAQDKECSITLISLDGHYPYRRDMFAPLIANDIEPVKVFERAKDFYVKNNVRIILDKKISRINIKKKVIFTEDKDQIDYETLIVTDTPENRYPSVKGATKDRIFGFKKLSDVERLLNEIPLIDTVAIHSGSFAGLQAAMACARRKKEVLLVSPVGSFLTAHFEENIAQWLINRFADVGVQIVRGNPLSEILGDKDAKAIRLQSGKVFATDLNIFVEMDEDLRLFFETDLQFEKKILVDQQFRTNIESIFAIDQACTYKDPSVAIICGDQLTIPDPITPYPVLEEQAKTVVAAIYGQEQTFVFPLMSKSLQFEGHSITVIGKLLKGNDIEIKRTFDQEASKYKGLYIKDGCVVGAVLINCEVEKQDISAMIENKTPGEGLGGLKNEELMLNGAQPAISHKGEEQLRN